MRIAYNVTLVVDEDVDMDEGMNIPEADMAVEAEEVAAEAVDEVVVTIVRTTIATTIVKHRR